MFLFKCGGPKVPVWKALVFSFSFDAFFVFFLLQDLCLRSISPWIAVNVCTLVSGFASGDHLRKVAVRLDPCTSSFFC